MVESMKLIGWIGILVCAALWAGCATSTVEKRRTERSASYAALSPENRQMVDQGKIKVGMNEDAVYIALGKPSDKLVNETSEGREDIWVYVETTLKSEYYYSDRPIGHRHNDTPHYGHTLEQDYVPRDYVRLEVTFKNGNVTRWRTLPKPMD